MKESNPAYQFWIGFWTAIGAAAAAGVIALFLWLGRHIAGVPEWAAIRAWGLIPTGKEVWTISLCLFGVGLTLIALSFFIFFAQIFNVIKRVRKLEADLVSGKKRKGDLTLGELALIQRLRPEIYKELH